MRRYLLKLKIDVEENNQTIAEPDPGPILGDNGQILMPFFATLIVMTILGNLLVMTAVFTDRYLKRRNSNFFFVSLAMADLTVATLVMPFALENDMGNGWWFGEVWCRLWLSTDVTSATSSILHLCVISYDRLISIQYPIQYNAWMTKGCVAKYIACIWIVSACIAFVPIYLDWHTVPDNNGVDMEHCTLNLNVYYAVGSSCVSFYIPAVVMVVNSTRLYREALRRSRTVLRASDSLPNRDMIRPTKIILTLSNLVNQIASTLKFFYLGNKAVFTLGVVNGVFLSCWLPFFVVNVITPWCDCVTILCFQIVTWLGYANSCMNPIIYPVFIPKFRHAYEHILCPRWMQKTNKVINGIGCSQASSLTTTAVKPSAITKESKLLSITSTPARSKSLISVNTQLLVTLTTVRSKSLTDIYDYRTLDKTGLTKSLTSPNLPVSPLSAAVVLESVQTSQTYNSSSHEPLAHEDSSPANAFVETPE
jgi:hypothetical protein